MTPHSVIEGVRHATVEGHVKHWHIELVTESVQHITRAVHFDFGPVRPLVQHVEFGHDLLRRGLFRLPFDTVFLTGETIPRTGICISQDVVGNVLRRLVWFTCAPAISADGSIDFDMPSLWGELVPTVPHAVNLIENGTVNWKSLTVDPHRSRKDRNRVWGPEDYHDAAEKVLNFVEGAVVFLMSKNADVKTEPAPDKLNKQRIAKGRFPVGARMVVRIAPEHRDAYRSAQSGEGGRVMSCHFRRGHFRELAHPRKIDGATIVPVAPTIVGANADAKPIAKRYEVAP